MPEHVCTAKRPESVKVEGTVVFTLLRPTHDHVSLQIQDLLGEGGTGAEERFQSDIIGSRSTRTLSPKQVQRGEDRIANAVPFSRTRNIDRPGAVLILDTSIEGSVIVCLSSHALLPILPSALSTRSRAARSMLSPHVSRRDSTLSSERLLS